MSPSPVTCLGLQIRDSPEHFSDTFPSCQSIPLALDTGEFLGLLGKGGGSLGST